MNIAQPAESVFYSFVFVGIKKTYPMQASKTMHGLWSMGQMVFTKYLVVADADVNVRNAGEIVTATYRVSTGQRNCPATVSNAPGRH